MSMWYSPIVRKFITRFMPALIDPEPPMQSSMSSPSAAAAGRVRPRVDGSSRSPPGLTNPSAGLYTWKALFH
jgi:hypothetical protein